MSGGSLWHNLIKDNFARAVANRLSGGSCRVVTSDQRLKLASLGIAVPVAEIYEGVEFPPAAPAR